MQEPTTTNYPDKPADEAQFKAEFQLNDYPDLKLQSQSFSWKENVIDLNFKVSGSLPVSVKVRDALSGIKFKKFKIHK
jgi:hypothetical protein